MLVTCPKCGVYHEAPRDGTPCHRCEVAALSPALRRDHVKRCWRCAVRARLAPEDPRHGR